MQKRVQTDTYAEMQCTVSDGLFAHSQKHPAGQNCVLHVLHASISAVFRKLINKNGDALAFLLILLVANVGVQSAVRDSGNVLILRDERESRRPAPWFNAFMSLSTRRD